MELRLSLKMILLKSDEICSLLWHSAVSENPTNVLVGG